MVRVWQNAQIFSYGNESVLAISENGVQNIFILVGADHHIDRFK